LLLDVSKCKELSEIDVDDCRNIVEFHCFPHKQLRTLSIKGCIKLRRIGGLDDDARKRLKVDLNAISKSGSLNEVSFPFGNLNCSQVDDILQLINNALIVKARDTDNNEALEYSINFLKPGEYTNTNNTGEVYAYELCCGSSGHGEHNPEDCLQTAILEIADDFDIEGENLTEIVNNTLFHIRSLHENISIEQEKIVNSKIEITNEMAAFISKFGGYSGNENTTFEYTPTLIIGSKVNHNKFGDGVVLNRVGAGGDERAQVEFSGVGIKWFALSVAKLSVLD
jgi:hypothetical protein